jgi:hypothetical protein
MSASDSMVSEWQFSQFLTVSGGMIPKVAAADSRPDSGTGSWLFEINMRMWRYGRNFPRQFSAEQAVDMRKRGCRKPGQEELRL